MEASSILPSNSPNTTKQIALPLPEDVAPEVASAFDPIAAGPHPDEGLQLFYRDDPGKEHLEIAPEQYRQVFSEQSKSRHKIWVWALVVTTTAVVFGLAVGLGVHFGSHNGMGQDSSNATAAPDTIASMTAFANASASATGSSAISTPTNDVVPLECNNTIPNTFTTTANPTVFIEDCYTNYAVGNPAWNAPSVNVTNVANLVAYSFPDCMEQCAKYNAQKPRIACQALSWTGQVAYNIRAHGGNCWLKDRRVERAYGGDPNFDYSLMASAYIEASI